MKKFLFFLLTSSFLIIGCNDDKQKIIIQKENVVTAFSHPNLQQYIDSHQEVTLGVGIWEISEPLSIPSNTKITGIRGATIIKLTGNATSIINLDVSSKNITIENITFQGKKPITKTVLTPTDIKKKKGMGSDCGIYAIGYAQNIHIRNCEFINFSLAGIHLYRTHDKYTRGFKITDCVFGESYIGLLSDVRSEYHTITGSTFAYNQIGAFIAGGNNFMSTCHFDGNSVGCVINGTAEDNDSHGSIVSSSFNHNRSYSLALIDINNGFTFSGCHAWEGDILLDNAKGFVFVGGEIVCGIQQININEAPNMIHSTLFVKSYGGGEITDRDKLSLKNNFYIDGSDHSDINN